MLVFMLINVNVMSCHLILSHVMSYYVHISFRYLCIMYALAEMKPDGFKRAGPFKRMSCVWNPPSKCHSQHQR